MYTFKIEKRIKQLGSRYKSLSKKDRYMIFLTILRNDFRVFNSTNILLNKIVVNYNQNQNTTEIKPQIIALRQEIVEQLGQNPKKETVLKNIINNVDRFLAEDIPYIHYAFDKWQSESNNFGLLELTVFYIYNLIPQKIVQTGDNQFFIGKGAYFDVYKDSKKLIVYKYPKNIFANDFLIDFEYYIYSKLTKEDICRYLPKLFPIKDNNVIIKEYVSGPTGVELLKLGGLSDDQLEKLNEFYQLSRLVEKKYNLHFDLHPNNFIWSIKNNKWMFVDIGFIPEIGSDYYPKQNFSKYYKKIWIDRENMMKKYPIRSVDIEIR